MTKIIACISSSVVYPMSLTLLHKTTIEQIDKPTRAFLWYGRENKKRYYFVRWPIVCKPRKKGGLGIKHIRKFNVSLMCKWWWKLEAEEGPWQDFMREKM